MNRLFGGRDEVNCHRMVRTATTRWYRSPLPPLLICGRTCFPPGVTSASVGVETCGQGLGTVRTGTPMGFTTGELLEPPDPESEEEK